MATTHGFDVSSAKKPASVLLLSLVLLCILGKCVFGSGHDLSHLASSKFFVYALTSQSNDPGGSRISQYEEQSDGRLLPLNPGSVDLNASASCAILDKEGKLLFVLCNDYAIKTYQVAPSGQLGLVSPEFHVVPESNEVPTCLAISPGGDTLYVGQLGPDIYTLSVSPRGRLKQECVSPLGRHGVGATSIAAFGDCVYVSCTNSDSPVATGDVLELRRRPDGALIPLEPAYFINGQTGEYFPNPEQLTISPGNNCIYLNTGQAVVGFKAADDGTLHQLPNVQIPGQGNEAEIFASPDDRLLYVAISASVSVYRIMADGALASPRTVSTYWDGISSPTPIPNLTSYCVIEDLAIDAVRHHVYVSDRGFARICTYKTAVSGLFLPTHIPDVRTKEWVVGIFGVQK